MAYEHRKSSCIWSYEVITDLWWWFYTRYQWLRWYRICLQCRRPEFDSWLGKFPWRREWLPTPVFLPGEFHGQRSLVDYNPWSCKESDTTEWLTLHFSLGEKLTFMMPGGAFKLFFHRVSSESKQNDKSKKVR